MLLDIILIEKVNSFLQTFDCCDEAMRSLEHNFVAVNAGNNFFGWYGSTIKKVLTDNVFSDVVEWTKNFFIMEWFESNKAYTFIGRLSSWLEYDDVEVGKKFFQAFRDIYKM